MATAYLFTAAISFSLKAMVGFPRPYRYFASRLHDIYFVQGVTILDNFRLAAIRSQRKKITIGINDSFKKKVRERIASLDMGLENKIYQPIGSLSGGQRQALTLLMSAMDNTNVLLLDEPTAALDPKSSQVVLNLAARLNIDDGITVILVTHNLKDATQNGNRLIQMHQGKILRDLNARAKDELLLQDIYKWFD